MPATGAHGRASIRDVARLAGVSPGCVSNVINRRRSQTDPIGRAVMAAVRDLGYRPNPIAANLRRATSRFIGVVVPDFENPFFGRLVAELERCAEASEFRIVASSSREDPRIETREIAEFLDWKVAGLILAPATGATEAPRDTGGAPLVIVDRVAGAGRVDEVGIDNEEAAEAVVRRLVALGRRDILLAYSAAGIANVGARIAGAEAGANGARLRHLACGPGVESSAAAIEAHLAAEPMPEAIFCLNNLATLAALGTVQRRGLVPGRDLALVSFDDSAWMAHMHPRIAAVAQPVTGIARTAWDCLTGRIEGRDGPPVRHRLQCSFEPRDTVSPMTGRADARAPNP